MAQPAGMNSATLSVDDQPTEVSPEELAADRKRGLIFNIICLALLAGVGSALDALESAAVSLAVNWFVFLIHALPFDSEKYFDATGTLTYLTLIGYTVFRYGLNFTEVSRGLVMAVLAAVWAVRLGSFLLIRICQVGKDVRFEKFRRTAIFFLGVWSMQAVWCFFVVCPVLVIIKEQASGSCSGALNVGDYVAFALWLIAFLFEVVADKQKDAFRKNSTNKGKFITEGLWAYSQHPNYFGEISMWVAIAISATSSMCLSVLQYFVWMSPLTTFVLLNFVSGVPLLKKAGEERWGSDPAYRWYVEKTPQIFPSIIRPPAYDRSSASTGAELM